MRVVLHNMRWTFTHTTKEVGMVHDTWLSHTHTHTHTHIHTYTHIYTHKHTHIYNHTHTCTHKHIHITHIHTHAQTGTHTHIISTTTLRSSTALIFRNHNLLLLFCSAVLWSSVRCGGCGEQRCTDTGISRDRSGLKHVGTGAGPQARSDR